MPEPSKKYLQALDYIKDSKTSNLSVFEMENIQPGTTGQIEAGKISVIAAVRSR